MWKHCVEEMQEEGMEIRSWKGDLRGAMFLAKEDIEN
jgi:hypothetical protein